MAGIDRSKEYAGVPLPQVRIMTDRLLSADTTEKVLNAIGSNEFIISHVRRIDIKGENIPAKVNSGPNRGIENNHSERKVIKFGTQELELSKLVGDFYIELLVKDEEEQDKVVEEIKSVCEQVVPFGFAISVGRYSKYRSTLSDTY